MTRSKITLSMVVRNESDRYLKRVLFEHRSFIHNAVIIDDCSTDNTVDVCKEMLEGIPLTLIVNEDSKFSNEFLLRKQQWEATVATNPQWILNLDADELLDSDFSSEIDTLLNQDKYHVVYFRLYDMWDEDHYREDGYWIAHTVHRPFLVRWVPSLDYTWQTTKQHCGRFPRNIYSFPYCLTKTRIRHYGWARLDDRQKKYERYCELDPDGIYGYIGQYKSILDKNPKLIKWEG